MHEKPLWDSADDRQEQQQIQQQMEKRAAEQAKWALYAQLERRRESLAMRKEDKARYRKLAQNLRQLRKKAGLNQATAARMMGRSQSWIAKIEDATMGGKISYVEMERLAVAYGCTLRDFRTIEPEELKGVRADANWDCYLGLSNKSWARITNEDTAKQVQKRKPRS